MINFRQLDINDAESAIDIVSSRPDVFMGNSDDQFKNELIENLPLALMDPLCFSLGFFEHGQLIGFGLFKEMTTQPAWVWGHWVTKQGDQKHLANRQTFYLLNDMMNVIFEEMEGRGLYRFYTAYKYNGENKNDLRSLGATDRLVDFITRYQKNHNPNYNFRGTQYKFFTDCVIPANTAPPYSYQQAIIGDRTWPIDIGIRIGLLDQSKDKGS